MRRQYFDYRPRPQFRGFIGARSDWTCHAADAFRYLAMTLDRTVSVRNFSRGLEYPNLGIV
jgi:hypothetical protein